MPGGGIDRILSFNNTLISDLHRKQAPRRFPGNFGGKQTSVCNNSLSKEEKYVSYINLIYVHVFK